MKIKRGVFIFWGLFIVLAGLRLYFSFEIDKPDISQCLKQISLGTGQIIEEPQRKETGQVFVVRVNTLSLLSSTASSEESQVLCSNNILLRMKAPLYPRFAYGDTISFQGKISKPFNFRSDDGRKFDYEGYLAKDQVFYEMKSAQVIFLEKGKNNLYTALYTLKRKFVANLERVLGEPYAALAAGLLVGEKSALGADLISDFRTVGLIHIVVLSGYNITIVGDALRKLLSFLPRVWGIVAGALGIIAFGILVGGGATVVRSCCMSSIALSADLLRRDYRVDRALFFAGLIMIIQNPLILLHDPSFQLSFLATFGLIILSSPIEVRLSFITDKYGLRGIVASSIATQIFVSPYIVYMMGSISMIGFISNILVLPFVPLTMLMVFITGLTGFIWTSMSTIIAWLAHILLSYELTIVRYAAKIPLAAIHFPQFSGWIVVFIYALYLSIYTKSIWNKKFIT